MKVKFSDIKWDTDGTSAKELDLPSKCVLEVEDDTDLEQEAADVLSDRFGYCVLSLNFEVQAPKRRKAGPRP